MDGSLEIVVAVDVGYGGLFHFLPWRRIFLVLGFEADIGLHVTWYGGQVEGFCGYVRAIGVAVGNLTFLPRGDDIIGVFVKFFLICLVV